MMMKQAGVTFMDWAEELPNAKYINWEDPSIKFDMGYPVTGQEAPWMTAQHQAIYDTDIYAENELPHDFTEFFEFAKANSGMITYPGPPDFMGTRLIKSAMYELTGGFEQYNKEDITKDAFEKMSEPLWVYLEELKPYLWKEGRTYPSSVQQTSLFNNGETTFAYTMNGMGIDRDITDGKLPESAKIYCFDTAIGDTNYVALTFNGANKAGAMVVANIIEDPAIQSLNISATGGAPAYDFSTLSAEQVSDYEAEVSKLRDGSYSSLEEKARTLAPEVSSYLNIYIEEIWNERIGIN
jgi:ABC-type uncharacterized transport system YnjBCD substrate-binding protein